MNINVKGPHTLVRAFCIRYCSPCHGSFRSNNDRMLKETIHLCYRFVERLNLLGWGFNCRAALQFHYT